MHQYLRAIGFSNITDRKKMNDLVTRCIIGPTSHAITLNKDENMIGDFCKDFAENIGIAVCGEYDEKEFFVYEYYYPYLRSNLISSTEDVSVERHASQESFAGICDDMKVGISLIFYLQNRIPYIKAQYCDMLPMVGTSITLTALSIKGTVMLPLLKNEKQVQKVKKETKNRNKLIAKARQGDEDALETLTLEDMDIYTNISRKIQKEDVYSLVDTYFMPYGVECDHYSILGEINAVKKVTNSLTQEEIYILTVTCNELTLDLCINQADLFGEPEVGRRFKGIVWLQGVINFPD